MTVLIIGENKVNDHVYEFFTQKGMEVIIVSDVYRLRSVTGGIGCFNITIKKDEVIEDQHYNDIDFIILTEQPTAKPVEIAGLPVLSLYDDKEYDIPAKAAVSEPIVFLLDHICESPMSATFLALNDATIFAYKKRNVFFMLITKMVGIPGMNSLFFWKSY